jgi:hypothetical protein
MPLAGRPLEGEHDCLFGLPLEAGSIDEERAEGAPGLPLVAETDLSGTVVLKLGGASSEKSGISDGFHGLDLPVGEVPRDGTGCFDTTGVGLEIEEVLTGGADMLGTFDGVDVLRVGVDALDVGLEVDNVGMLVGVEGLVFLDKGVEDLEGSVALAERTVSLAEGNVDLAAGTVVVLMTGTVVLVEETTGLVVATVVLVEGMDVREVGVEGLDDFEDVVNVDRPVGVAGLDPVLTDDDKGLLAPPPEELNLGEEACCLDTKLVLLLCSDGGFANCNHNEANSRRVTSG